ncbi:NAD(P)/FAD-dependent oxidoreductase, partial [Streptomyces sp. SID11233]|nr:NAD(P)/FAD-dependent oxidoreductase [Streptomyces sp. SID11233]
GRHVMQFVCRDDDKEFTASVDTHGPLPTHRVIPVGPRVPGPAAGPADDGAVSVRVPQKEESR